MVFAELSYWFKHKSRIKFISIMPTDIRNPLLTEEQEHYQQLSSEVRKRLDMTSEGLKYCYDLIASRASRKTSTSLEIIMLLSVKAMDHLRAARLCTEIGCHQSTPVLLQVALTSTAMMLVAKKDRKFREKWMFFTSAGREHFAEGTPARRFDDIIRGFERRAVNAYGAYISPDNPSTVDDLIDGFRIHSIPSLAGLMEGLDSLVDDSYEYHHELLQHFYGEDGMAALDAGNGDPEKAFEALWERLKTRGRSKPDGTADGEEAEQEEFELGPGAVRPGLADFHSSIILAATHHLYDILNKWMGKALSAEARKAADNWHDIVMSM